MADLHLETCPLCNAIANFEYTDRKNGQYFYCDYCKNFEIVGRAMREPLNETIRRECAKLSKSLNDDQFLQLYFDKYKIRYKVVNRAY